jgi:hypothetical protein
MLPRCWFRALRVGRLPTVQARKLPPTAHRGGYVLLLFVLLLAALMALAALVIDMGLARVTQRQMQSAADTAALVGLRLRDELQALDRDVSRRIAASQIVAQQFDDDFQPDTPDGAHLGAGPMFAWQGGRALGGSTFRASAELMLPAPPVYEPRLQLNLENAAWGDLVAGRAAMRVPPPGDPHDRFPESADYARRDFDPLDPAVDAPAFLARLRRTDEAQLWPAENGIASAGPPVPFLFGHGGGVLRAVSDAVGNPIDPLALWERRARGTAVRATAIAAVDVDVYDAQGTLQATRPIGLALCVGPAHPQAMYASGGSSPPLEGWAPLLLDNSQGFWTQLASEELRVDTAGNLHRAAEVVGRLSGGTRLQADVAASDTHIDVAAPMPPVAQLPFRVRIGRELLLVTSVEATRWSVQRGVLGTTPQPHAADTPVLLQRVVQSGQRAADWAALTAFDLAQLPDPSLHTYVPIALPLGGESLVVAFGRAIWEVRPPELPGEAFRLLLTKQTDPAPFVAPRNASTATQSVPAAVAGALWQAASSLPDAVRAPVLFR